MDGSGHPSSFNSSLRSNPYSLILCLLFATNSPDHYKLHKKGLELGLGVGEGVGLGYFHIRDGF